MALGDMLRASQITATASQMAYLIDEGTRAMFRSAALRAAREVIPRGVVDPARVLDVTTELPRPLRQLQRPTVQLHHDHRRRG